MSMFRTKSAGGAKSFRPQLETLDAREVPAVLVSEFTSLPGFSGRVLKFDGTDGVDTVTVWDYGDNLNSNIAFKVGNGDWQYSQGAIETLVFDLKGDADAVLYQLSGDNLLNGVRREVRADLGAGQDTFTAELYGALHTNSSLKLSVNGGDQADNLAVNVRNDVHSAARLNIALSGGQGNDVIRVDATQGVDIAAAPGWTKGVMAADLFGDDGNDTITALYAGDLDGSLLVNSNGGSGVDIMKTDITMAAGSDGKTDPTMHGGNDVGVPDFRIHNRGTAKSGSSAQLWGDGGVDIVTRTVDVRFNDPIEFVGPVYYRLPVVESDTIVPS